MNKPLRPEDLESAGIESVVVAAPDMHGELIGKRLPPGKFREFMHSGIGVSSCTFGWDLAQDIGPNLSYAGGHTGWRDFLLIPDLTTLTKAAWLNRTAIALADIREEHDKSPVAITPREILRRQLQEFSELGFEVQVATELEFHLFDQTFAEIHDQDYRGLSPATRIHADYKIQATNSIEPFFGPLRKALDESGLDVEMSQGEWGFGQFEINLTYGSALQACDRHVLFKLAMKDAANDAGYSVTFMPMPRTGEVGSSCHIHLSLRKSGLETDTEPFAYWSDDDPHHMSETLRHSIGGILLSAPDLMLLYAPTINSYRRTNSNEFSGNGATWGFDNRTVSCRVIGGSPSTIRLEWRVPGADANPYLAVAGVLASVQRGIREGIDPGMPFLGDAYEAGSRQEFPRTLPEAITNFRTSEFAANAFGSAVQDQYCTYYSWESKLFDEAVTDWELRRYFRNT